MNDTNILTRIKKEERESTDGTFMSMKRRHPPPDNTRQQPLIRELHSKQPWAVQMVGHTGE